MSKKALEFQDNPLRDWRPQYPEEVDSMIRTMGFEPHPKIKTNVVLAIGTSKPLRIIFEVNGKSLDHVQLTVQLPCTPVGLRAKYKAVHDYATSVHGAASIADRTFDMALEITNHLPHPGELLRVRMEDNRFTLAPILNFPNPEVLARFKHHMETHFPRIWDGHLAHMRSETDVT